MSIFRIKKHWVVVGIFSATISLVSCQNSESSTPVEEAPKSTVDPADYVNDPMGVPSSELAALMRKMFENNKEAREVIMSGGLPENFLEEYKKLHTSGATDSSQITDTYYAMADAYLQSVEAVSSVEEENRVEAFNNMVNTCISCHEAVSCRGPIPKIRTLRIKGDEA